MDKIKIHNLEFNLLSLTKELDEVKLRELLNFLGSIKLVSLEKNEISTKKDLDELIEENKELIQIQLENLGTEISLPKIKDELYKLFGLTEEQLNNFLDKDFHKNLLNTFNHSKLERFFLL